MRKLQVFFDPRQAVVNNPCVSPSAGKPALVLQEWQRRNYDIEITGVTPVTRADFYRVHNRKHVDEVLDLRRANGFSNRLPEIAASLYWTSGSLVSACVFALGSGENACSPTSGFHHAEWWKADGFCTFNGLVLAAVKVRDLLPYCRVGILDIDMHYGNGTDEIIKRLGLSFIRHYTFGGAHPHAYDWRGGQQADAWLGTLPGVVETFEDCDIVIYQAGADPHKDDPYGGALSDDQLRERDRIVFSTLRQHGIPCVWNLAGGYQTPIQKVLDIHNATLEECLRVAAI